MLHKTRKKGGCVGPLLANGAIKLPKSDSYLYLASPMPNRAAKDIGLASSELVYVSPKYHAAASSMAAATSRPSISASPSPYSTGRSSSVISLCSKSGGLVLHHVPDVHRAVAEVLRNFPPTKRCVLLVPPPPPSFFFFNVFSFPSSSGCCSPCRLLLPAQPAVVSVYEVAQARWYVAQGLPRRLVRC